MTTHPPSLTQFTSSSSRSLKSDERESSIHSSLPLTYCSSADSCVSESSFHPKIGKIPRQVKKSLDGFPVQDPHTLQASVSTCTVIDKQYGKHSHRSLNSGNIGCNTQTEMLVLPSNHFEDSNMSGHNGNQLHVHTSPRFQWHVHNHYHGCSMHQTNSQCCANIPSRVFKSEDDHEDMWEQTGTYIYIYKAVTHTCIYTILWTSKHIIYKHALYTIYIGNAQYTIREICMDTERISTPTLSSNNNVRV